MAAASAQLAMGMQLDSLAVQIILAVSFWGLMSRGVHVTARPEAEWKKNKELTATNRLVIRRRLCLRASIGSRTAN